MIRKKISVLELLSIYRGLAEALQDQEGNVQKGMTKEYEAFWERSPPYTQVKSNTWHSPYLRVKNHSIALRKVTFLSWFLNFESGVGADFEGFSLNFRVLLLKMLLRCSLITLLYKVSDNTFFLIIYIYMFYWIPLKQILSFPWDMDLPWMAPLSPYPQYASNLAIPSRAKLPLCTHYFFSANRYKVKGNFFLLLEKRFCSK